MPYTPTTWGEGITTLGPTNMNKIETELARLKVNADLDPAAAIAYSKLNLALGIVNGDVSASAAIALSKLADPGTGNVVTSIGAGAIAAKPPGYEYAYNEFTAPVATAVTTEATAATVVTASAVTFDGATPVWVEFSCSNMSNSVGAAFPIIVLYDGAASIGKMAEQDLFTANYGFPLLCKRRITPSAAAHTYSARIYTNAGTVTVNGGAGGVGNFMPGFIRITKA